MERLRKLARLAPDDRLLLVEAAVAVVTVRAGLWLLPFPTFRRLAARWTRRRARANHPDPGRLVWAVRAVSRTVPGASCLTQALSAQILLARRSHPAELRIGVARGAQERFEAHAWLEHEGRVIIGGAGGLARYTPLSALEACRT